MAKKPKSLEGRIVRFDVPYFDMYLAPEGFLDKDPACHALWFYYTRARLNYENVELDPIVYEGEKDPMMDNFQLFKSVALMYGCAPEALLKFWPAVRMQYRKLGLPELPQKYVFDKVPEIKTQ